MHSYEEEFPEKNETGDTISCFATGVDRSEERRVGKEV